MNLCLDSTVFGQNRPGDSLVSFPTPYSLQPQHLGPASTVSFRLAPCCWSAMTPLICQNYSTEAEAPEAAVKPGLLASAALLHPSLSDHDRNHVAQEGMGHPASQYLRGSLMGPSIRSCKHRSCEFFQDAQKPSHGEWGKIQEAVSDLHSRGSAQTNLIPS